MGSRHRIHKHARPEDCFTVTVRLLEDDTADEVEVPEDATGKWLFDEICRRQGVTEEREYFGLRYLEHEMLSSPTKQWLDLSRGILSQLKHTHPRTVSFRIKHYPAEPMADLRLPKTHYLLYRQLRRDLCSGRLVAQLDEMIRLGALVAQVELGDSSMQDGVQFSSKGDAECSYLKNFQVLHNQSTRMESLLLEEHKKLEGLLPSEAASEMILLASSLETYGVDPIRVKTKSYGSKPIHLGLTHRGVAEFISNRCQRLFLWSNISWMTCDGKYFIVAVSKTTSGKRKKSIETVQYKCENKSVARALWEWASDRQLFLTLEKSSAAKPVKSKRGFFSRTHTFKFSGRCRREVLGRPSLAATLPMDISMSQIAPPENMLDSQTQSGNPHSISMVALAHESSTPECRLRTIGELDTPDESKTFLASGAAATQTASEAPVGLNQLDGTVPYSTGSVGRSQISTIQSVASEPLNNSHQAQRVYSPVRQQQNAAGYNTIGYKCLENADFGTRQVHPDQLVIFFKDMPRRRYAPEAIIKQRKLVQPCRSVSMQFNSEARMLSRTERHSDIFDTDDEGDITSEDALAALQSAAEAGQAWAAQGNGATAKEMEKSSVEKSSTFSWSRLISAPSVSNSTPNHKVLVSQEMTTETGNQSDSTIYRDVDQERDEDNSSVPVSGWRLITLSMAFLTGASLVGLTVLLETEIHSPLTAAIRGHPWLLEFDARYYRPLRSALFNLWRR